MKWPVLKFAVVVLFFSSCLMQSPKYTSLENVTSLELGMTKAQVEERLNLEPYDLKAYTDTSNIFIYVYRTHERRTLSFYTEEKNGRHALGKYVQLFVTYSKKNNKVIQVESCSECPNDLNRRIKIDYEKIYAFVTVTLPVILIYIGLKQTK
jgi:hypothetical protein